MENKRALAQYPYSRGRVDHVHSHENFTGLAKELMRATLGP